MSTIMLEQGRGPEPALGGLSRTADHSDLSGSAVGCDYAPPLGGDNRTGRPEGDNDTPTHVVLRLR